MLILLAMLVAALWAQGPINQPRVYVQRLILDDGTTPQVTWIDQVSAPEYRLTAYIKDVGLDTLSTNVQPHYTIGVKRVGDGVIPEPMVIAYLQLGNFKTVWKPGQTICFELTYLANGEKLNWELLIPEGSNLLRYLDEALIIPPYSKKSE